MTITMEVGMHKMSSFTKEINSYLNPNNCIFLKDLVKNPRFLPNANGLYIVQVPHNIISVNFLNTTTAPIIWKGESTVVNKNFLSDKFNQGDKSTVYIGSAHHIKGNGLKSRVAQFIKYGTNYMSKSGKPASHNGGCYLWQIENWGELLLYWYETEDSKAIERKLLNLYVDEYGVLPLANRV